MSIELIVTIIIAVISSSWFGNWISNHTSKNDIIELIHKLEAKIDSNEAKRDMKDAEHTRSKILRFDDELRMNIKHSQEYFDDIIKDIDDYEKYCASNPNFKNRKAESAINHIMQAYNQCHQQNDFL